MAWGALFAQPGRRGLPGMQHAATPLAVLALLGGASAYSAGPLDSASPSGVLAEDVAMLAVPSRAEVSEDLGAPYAATEPLLGVSVPFVPASSKKAQLPRAACAPLAAAIARHTFWFKGAEERPANITDPQTTVLPGSSNQQDGQRNFLRKISTSLCARGHDQTDDEYTTILHGMLDEVRTHINRHVHSAFWVKATCAEIDLCYYNREDVPGLPLDALINSTLTYLLPEVNLCLDTVLLHEKYNLAEGFTFVDIQYTLLSRGAAFCTDPERDAILSRWNTTLEDAMAYHAGNHAFDDMLAAHFAQVVCDPLPCVRVRRPSLRARTQAQLRLTSRPTSASYPVLHHIIIAVHRARRVRGPVRRDLCRCCRSDRC